MSHLGHLDLAREGDAVVARVVGEVDASNANELASALRSAVPDARSRGLVLDLSSTAYLDSTAVRLVFELDHEMKSRQRQLRLVVPKGAATEKVLQLTRVLWTVPHDDTVEGALARLRTEVQMPLPRDQWLGNRSGSSSANSGLGPGTAPQPT
jgi:anti-anti-sigma factor